MTPDFEKKLQEFIDIWTTPGHEEETEGAFRKSIIELCEQYARQPLPEITDEEIKIMLSNLLISRLKANRIRMINYHALQGNSLELDRAFIEGVEHGAKWYRKQLKK